MLRELNSILPKPNQIADFNCVSKDTIANLAKIGIKTTEKLFDKVITKLDRQNLSESTGIAERELLKLTKLTDLSRIKWVGITYAQILYDIGVDTVEKVSKSDPNALHAKINQKIRDENIFKGSIGLNDVMILIKRLPLKFLWK